MISYAQFHKLLSAVKETGEKTHKFNSMMEEFSDTWFISTLHIPATTAILEFLKDIFDDQDDWIGYCVYEKEWFTKDVKATYKDGSVIPLNNIAELYDFLIANTKKD